MPIQSTSRRSHCAYLLLVLLFGIACSPRETPQIVYDRAKVALQHGDVADAQQQADKGYSEFHRVNSDWAWKFLILKARALHRQGRYEETLALVASEPDAPPSSELAVKRLWVQGLAYTALHEFTKAEQALRQSEPICREEKLTACADVATARGTLEMERGHYADARSFFTDVLGTARESADQLWIANAMLDLSWAADELAHFDEALDWAGRSAQIAEHQKYVVVHETALGNMGWAYYKLGDRDKARDMFSEAETQAEKAGDSSGQISWLTNAGYCDMDDAKFDVARHAFSMALELARKAKSREDIINSLIALAFVSEQTGKLDDAKRYAGEALALAQADGNKRDQTYPRLVQGRVAAREHDAAAAEAAFHEVTESSDSPVFLRWEAQRSLARLFEDENQNEKAEAEYRAALSTFESARSELQHENSRLPFLTNASGIYDDYVQFLLEQGKMDEALQVANYSRARTLSEGLGILKKTTSFHPDPVNAQAIAQRAGGTILFYWLGDEHSYLWAVTSKKVALFDLPPARDIDKVVERYRKALLGPQDPVETVNSDGTSLYRMLIAPAENLFSKESKVFIIPDGSLNTLNFEALLVDGAVPHYWIEDVDSVSSSSLRMLEASRPARSERRNLLLLGNAEMPVSAGYPELKKASVEMESVERHFSPDQQKVFARDQATPQSYLVTKPENFSYIHFVAHGTASRISPLDSAIVLSGKADDDSFKLYARNIVQKPLQADLVTISTCYGAGARAYSGEGLVGLSWAFLRAGAHNVIGALWEVSDVSTPQLMDDLYSELNQGKTPDVALRAAKLKMLHSRGPFHRPFYWAPFQLYTGS